MDSNYIRNFSIIAHIDHGKSTLADRMLLYTNAISSREFHEQILDDMELERERGITIKASAVRIYYDYKGNKYELNLIDTPGHVDFTSEVAKSIVCSEGAILLIDASQGVQAQTVANLNLAREYNLKIIPVINKIDLPSAMISQTETQIQDILGIDKKDIIKTSAKLGTGVEEIFKRIINDIPHPVGNLDSDLKAIVFDSYYDIYKGVVLYIRIFDGKIIPKTKIRLKSCDKVYEVEEIGILTPYPSGVQILQAGDVGFIICSIREPKDVVPGDTITYADSQVESFTLGFKPLKPMVFAGVYPVNPKDFLALREALEKLSLNDSAFSYRQEKSSALGAGFRCGFLGFLHMEIVQERLEREYGLSLILTTPNINYQIVKKNNEKIEISSPSQFPPMQEIKEIREPYVKGYILTPSKYISEIMELTKTKRAKFLAQKYYGIDKVGLNFEFPLAEIIVDFYDKLKSITKGYASLDYKFIGFKVSEIVKLDILINGEVCEPLSLLVHKKKANFKANQLTKKLKELIPRQLFEVVIQARMGSKIVSRQTIPPLKKHVTGKCYGGDITRKRKLWEKQKLGKKRMKKFGKVDIPQEAFLAILKL
jgi:GTP-binding protein LepA